VFSNPLRFYWKNNNEIATTGLNQYAHMHSEARDIAPFLEKHVLLSRERRRPRIIPFGPPPEPTLAVRRTSRARSTTASQAQKSVPTRQSVTRKIGTEKKVINI
jgi:hypothetical protein